MSDLETIKENKKSTFPTQMVELPSRGLLYPLDSPLSSGVVEINYMTTKEEDILTTESYIKTGVVIDKLLQSLIVNPAVLKCYDDLVLGDKTAIMIAARAYGYGELYEFEVETPSGKTQKVEVDLTTLQNKEIDVSLFKNENRFEFTLPLSKDKIEFKLLTVGDDRKIDEYLRKLKPVDGRNLQLSERMRAMILSVNGDSDLGTIKMYVSRMLAKDSRAMREYVAKLQPNVDVEVEVIDEETQEPFRTKIAFGTSFFWPNA